MRFISIFRPSVQHGPPTDKMMDEMGKFMSEAIAAGVLLATEGFGPSSASDSRVRLTKGNYQVTDGPFAEAKEVIGGFAIMNVKSKAELHEWTRRFMAIAGDGECELHQLSDASPMEFFKTTGNPRAC